MLLYVDVKLGPSESDIVRLEVRTGENVREVAKNFALKYGLDESKRRQMEGLLRDRLNERGL